MKLRVLFFSLALLYSFQLSAQSIIYTNTFDSENPGWQNYTSDLLSTTVSNGRFNFLYRKSEGYAVNASLIQLDNTRNFSYSTSMMHLAGVDNYPAGLSFGGKDVNNLYFFCLSANGNFLFGAFSQNTFKSIIPWTPSASIKSGNGVENKLRIEKTGAKLLFYINDVKVAENPMVDFFGDQTGFIIQKNQQVRFDYLTVAYLDTRVQPVAIVKPVDDNTGKIAYYTSFDADDANNWVLPPTDSVKTLLEGSKFIIRSRANQRATGSVTMPETWIDMSRDFLFETEAVHYEGTTQTGYGVSFGTDSLQSYYFLMASDYYCLGYNSRSGYKELIPWTVSSAIVKGDMVKNKLTVVNKGSKLNLYINDQLVNSFPAVSFSGHQFGVAVNGAQSVGYDYLSFKYLDNKVSVNPYQKKQVAAVADVSPPKITVTSPQVSTRGLKVVQNTEVLKVAGIATDPSGIFSVVVNGVQAKVDEQGNFWANIPLAIGDNPLMITATDLQMNKETFRFAVSKESAPVIQQPAANAVEGRNYALIIGIQNYKDETINDLEQPIADATSLFTVLKTSYTFDAADITLLKDPTREQLFDALESLSAKVKADDNLLIFYAGHGFWDETRKQGYWFPSDARKANRSTWLTNADLKEYIASIPSKHTLLITDACFAGSIFKTRSILAGADRAVTELYSLPSRKAMTSGHLKEVPDKSVFIEYLVKRLSQNTAKYLSSERLYSSFREAVINNSANGQVPQFGEIREAGDEGGDFIFIRR